METGKVLALSMLAAVLASSGCAATVDRPVAKPAQRTYEIEKDNCTENNQYPVNYVKITYDKNGYAYADPKECHAQPGTKIVWLMPAGAGSEFEVRFDKPNSTSPEKDGVATMTGVAQTGGELIAPMELKSEPGDDRGPYPYAIWSNGKELDPSIIIDW